jgi:circadian clock protein KaiB
MKNPDSVASRPAMAAPAAPDFFVLRLYVSQATPVSSRAIVNTRRFCEQHLPGRYRLDILNIADHVMRATQDQIVAAPTLFKASPAPVRRFIGDMSDTRRICAGLGLPELGTSELRGDAPHEAPFEATFEPTFEPAAAPAPAKAR